MPGAPLGPWVTAASRALALGLFDRGAGVPEARLEWMVADVASFLAHAGPKTTLLFRLTLLMVECLPLLVVGRWARCSRLTPPERASYLEALDRSRFAIMLALPKALLSMTYYEHPDARAETGYDGSCLLGELPQGVGLVHLPRGAERR